MQKQLKHLKTKVFNPFLSLIKIWIFHIFFIFINFETWKLRKFINGELPLSAFIPEYKKKYMDVDRKTVERLNIEKIKKFANEDGFYMIETNITNTDSKEVNEYIRDNEKWKKIKINNRS